MSASRLSYGPITFGGGSDKRLLKWQEHYRLDDRVISKSLGLQLDPVSADLLDVAVAVYVADRLCPRRPSGARRDGTWWPRDIHLRIALRQPRFWRESGALDALLELLHWLTDDQWTIDLVGGPPPRIDDGQKSLFSDTLSSPVGVTLFSGGLDSLLGAAEDAQRHGELILVAAGTGTRLRNKQHELAVLLRNLGPHPVRLLSVPVWLTKAGKDFAAGLVGVGDESSQRSRGLVFSALGAVVARAAGTNSLRIHENGPGALNLPLTPAQNGSMNTRAARPETLRSLGELMTRLFESHFEVINPAFWQTKAQMCAGARPELHPIMERSVTCDGGLTRRMRTGQLCGACTSCLLRRQALLASGLKQVDGSDLSMMSGDALRAPRRHADPMVIAMLSQAATIASALQAHDSWPVLVDNFPDLISARRALDSSPARLVGLLGRYVDDWRQLEYPLVRDLVPAG